MFTKITKFINGWPLYFGLLVFLGAIQILHAYGKFTGCR